MTVIEQINGALAQVKDPELHRPLPDLGMVESVTFSDGVAHIKILLTISGCPMQDRLRTDVTAAVTNISEVARVEVELGVMSEEQLNNVKKILRNGREKFIPFSQPDSRTRVIGVASGKGGVGKSSLTVNLAVATAQKGLSVGILDADVYGHSIPRLMGLIGLRPTALDRSMFIPLEAFGVKVVSMEMFKNERSDVIAFRGPLLHKSLEQLLADAYWGDLDILFIDLPPGTGDLAMSLGQLIPSSEVLIVTTPQIAASEVAERSGRLAHILKQHVIGVIENMSDFTSPISGELISLFGTGGGETTAESLSKLFGIEVPLLGKIPFNLELRTGGDAGTPVVLQNPESAAAIVIAKIATQIIVRSKSLVGRQLGITT
ncbi:MAG: Mrp/NBP35 family ATP-binding protein [Actinomycetota bacterium]|nr:Mrp/NBP35 family ATP-binding protein [Actinomycetota bacterium]